MNHPRFDKLGDTISSWRCDSILEDALIAATNEFKSKLEENNLTHEDKTLLQISCFCFFREHYRYAKCDKSLERKLEECDVIWSGDKVLIMLLENLYCAFIFEDKWKERMELTQKYLRLRSEKQ